MAEGKAMPFSAKNAVNGFNQKVKRRSKEKIMVITAEDIKYLGAFIFFYIYWQVLLWILVKNSKQKSERL